MRTSHSATGWLAGGSSAVVALSSQQLHPSWTSTSGGKCGVQLNPGHLQHPGHLSQLLMFPLSSFSAVSHQGGQPTPATWDPCPHPRCTRSQPCKPPSDKRPPQKQHQCWRKSLPLPIHVSNVFAMYPARPLPGAFITAMPRSCKLGCQS